MNKNKIGFLYLFLASMIWGGAIVAQRAGMRFISPFYFTGLRFVLGATALLLMMAFFSPPDEKTRSSEFPGMIKAGFICGLILFVGITLQQVGLVYTMAGKAAFITSFYLVLVPALGVFFKRRTSFMIWIGCILALIGLYFLSIKNDFTVASGDILIFAGSFAWAFHILAIDYFVKKYDPVKLSMVQFYVCGIISLLIAVFIEKIDFKSVKECAGPILYGSFLSVSIGYTLQSAGQKKVNPAIAAIILSLEAVFAVMAGWLILKEQLTFREIMGCLLMFAGITISCFNNNKEWSGSLLEFFHRK